MRRLAYGAGDFSRAVPPRGLHPGGPCTLACRCRSERVRQGDPAGSSSRLAALCDWLEHAPESPVVRYTRPGLDVDEVIDVLLPCAVPDLGTDVDTETCDTSDFTPVAPTDGSFSFSKRFDVPTDGLALGAGDSTSIALIGIAVIATGFMILGFAHRRAGPRHTL